MFALGAMLYHVLTGQAPYAGNTAADVVSAASQAACQPVSHHDPNLPEGLLAIVDRAMAPEPTDRFATAVAARRGARRLRRGRYCDPEATAGCSTSERRRRPSMRCAGGHALRRKPVFGRLTSLLELGFGAYFYIALALFGGIFGVAEWVTKGRHHLAPLVLAFAGCTALAGIVTACLGLDGGVYGRREPCARTPRSGGSSSPKALAKRSVTCRFR